MIDLSPQLRARRDDLLAKLSVLSNVRGQYLDPVAPTLRAPSRLEPGHTMRGKGTAHRPHLESREPPGVLDGRPKAFDPDRDDLFGWFCWRLERCNTSPEVRALCAEGEIRLAHVTHVVVRYTAPSIYGRAVNQAERDRRICEDYGGLSADEVSGIETALEGPISAENVRRVRLGHRSGGLDPETGAPLPAERKLQGDARKKRARELDRGCVPVREIARRFGVSHSTVLGWLGRRKAKA